MMSFFSVIISPYSLKAIRIEIVQSYKGTDKGRFLKPTNLWVLAPRV